MSFNGVNQFVNLGNHRKECFGNLTLCPGGYTIAFWVFFDVLIGDKYYLSSGGHTFRSDGMVMLTRNNQMLSVFRLRGLVWTCENKVIANTWYHITYTWSLSNGLNVFANGQFVIECKIPSASAYKNLGYDDFILGRPNTDYNSFGHGKIDEILFWDKLLDLQALGFLYSRY